MLAVPTRGRSEASFPTGASDRSSIDNRPSTADSSATGGAAVSPRTVKPPRPGAARAQRAAPASPVPGRRTTAVETGRSRDGAMTTVLQARRPVPRVALTLDEAAEALGVSRDHLERHILGDLRVIRVGRRLLVRIAELERWAERHEAVGA